MINASLNSKMKRWRHILHQMPEFGFETCDTAAFIVAKLNEFGIEEIQTGIGGTGVVATIRCGDSNKAIALRADMDALMIEEKNSVSYKSLRPGLMHACGHDGHTTTLLGAAEVLKREGGFNGVIHFVFQPAEEWGKGAQAMVDDNLMDRFPFEEIWGFHNMPGLPAGHFETRPGPIMSAEDNFEIILKGIGGHSSRPHDGNETLVPACSLILELQTIISRKVNPSETAVISVTELASDGTRNALPGTSVISGDVRSFNKKISKQIQMEIQKISNAVGSAHNLNVDFTYSNEFIPLINDAELTKISLEVAAGVFGNDKTNIAMEPMTGSEDFARFLNSVPGSYAFIGNGLDSAPLHNPNYDYNDDILKPGAEYLIAVARSRLSV
jgi:hippurate hydrolase